MLMLNGELFACGRCRYFDHSPDRREPTAKIFLEVLLEGRYPILAQLDTGAPYSILNREVAEAARLLQISGDEVKIRNKEGLFRGNLVKVPAKLVADSGESLDLEGTFFVSEDWSAGNFIGYSGFLDSIRSALDPSADHFYFGELGDRAG
jgi:hypothetical protein